MNLELELAQLQQGATKLEKETDPSQLPPPVTTLCAVECTVFVRASREQQREGASERGQVASLG